jgi:acylphosphatase
VSEAAHIFVSGKVQGVGFRNFTQRHATRLGLTGYTKNLPDGRVEIEVEGDREKIEDFVQRLRQGPPRSNVAAVGVSWKEPSSRFSDFLIAL